MIVNITSFGYFGFFLAKEMYKLNSLGKFYTNLPRVKTKMIPSRFIKYEPISSLPFLLEKIKFKKLSKNSYIGCVKIFDEWVAKKMTECDIFHSFSGFGLKSHMSARERYGAMTIVERGSSHIAFQNNILREEYQYWGIKYEELHPLIIEKEISEYQYCDNIIVQSSFAERTFIQQGVSKDKIIKLPLGVNLELFHKISKIDNKFRVLAMGTLSIRKGSLYLLEAIKNLNLPNIEFVFNGKISGEIDKLILPYLDLINQMGMRPFSELYKIYSNASVLVLPTIEDGFGNVIVEAMACGIPVIATTNCGASDVILDGVDGFIVPIRDTFAIQQKILFLYENPLICQEMGRAAMEKAKVLLSVNNHGDRAIEAFQKKLEIFRR